MSGFGTLFSGRYINGVSGPHPGVAFDIYTGLMVAVLVAAIVVYLRRRPLSRGVTPRRHLFRRTSQGMMYLTGFGLFFALMRYVQFTFLDMRIYSYLVILAAIAYAGYLTYYLTEHHALHMFHHSNLEAGKRYRGAPRRRPVPATAPTTKPAMQRGKRRR